MTPLWRRPLIVLTLFLIAVSVFVRFERLHSVPVALFSDEVDIAYHVTALRQTGLDYQGRFPIQFHSFSDVRTPLSIYSSYLLTLLGVDIESSVRLAPALFGLLSLVFVFLCTRQITYIFQMSDHTLVPLLMTLILSVTPWHYTYSRTGFEVSMLMAFFLSAFWLYLSGIRTSSYWRVLLSIFLLGLTPAIYSTAKFLIVGYLALLVPLRKKLPILVASLVLLLLPISILTLNGGVSQRFQELAIFTDPTTESQVNYHRELDLGPDKMVGSRPSFTSQLVHNKLTFWGSTFIYNLIKPFSLDYLFWAGDINQRHAVTGFGMLPLALLPIFILGLLALYRHSSKLFFVLVTVSIFALIPSALTRDGALHATRNFPLLIPILFVTIFGLRQIYHHLLIFLFLGLLSLNSLFYFHSYFYHYPYQSERDFHAPLKQVVLDSTEHADKSIIYTRQYEPALIFYLFYSQFPVSQFQRLIGTGDIYEHDLGALNLEGLKLKDHNIYFASPKPAEDHNPLRIRPAVYYLTESEILNLKLPQGATISAGFALPSGYALIHRVDYF
jgi:hypothetical protein